MNLVVIIGNLGQDPEVREAASTTVCKLRVATNERKKQGEQWVDHTEWHSVTLFGKRAESLGKMLNKGERVAVRGRLRTSSYEKDGEKRYRTEIIADDIELLGSKASKGDGDASFDYGA